MIARVIPAGIALGELVLNAFERVGSQNLIVSWLSAIRPHVYLIIVTEVCKSQMFTKIAHTSRRNRNNDVSFSSSIHSTHGVK